jgi:hypothetical protein
MNSKRKTVSIPHPAGRPEKSGRILLTVLFPAVKTAYVTVAGQSFAFGYGTLSEYCCSAAKLSRKAVQSKI